MRIAVAGCIMAIAVRCMGDQRREWALAMEAEFETAIDEGCSLSYAIGCLAAAWREMSRQEDGRFVLASHVLALGVILPIATLLLYSVARGFPFLAPNSASAAVLLGSGMPSFGINEANQTGLPLMALLTLMLGLGHLRMAWAILDRDWARVTTIGSSGAALLVTIVLFSSILFFGDGCAMPQAAVIAIELAAIWSLVRWHSDLPVAVPS